MTSRSSSTTACSTWCRLGRSQCIFHRRILSLGAAGGAPHVAVVVSLYSPHRHEVEQLIAGAAAGIPSALAVTYGASCDGSSRFLKEEHSHILLSCELRVAKVFRAAPPPC